MNFFSYMMDGLGNERKPKNETLAEHKKHCRAEEGNCPFEKRAAASAENEDSVKSEHDYRLDANGSELLPNAEFKKAIAALDQDHRIYAVSDIHSTDLNDMDIDGHGIVVIGGDFIERASEASGHSLEAETGEKKKADAEKFLNETFIPWMKKHSDKQFVIIPGNHDKYFQYHPDSTKWPDNAKFLVDDEVTVNGLRFYGTPWCYYNKDGAFEVDHDELKDRFSRIPEGVDVLIAHTPPRIDGSDIDYGAEHMGHFGSSELTDAILAKKPKLVICGHVHTGDHKPLQLGESMVVNVSKIGTKRNTTGFAGRTIGFEKGGAESPAEFIMDKDDGQQIHETAYAKEGEKLKGKLAFRSDGTIRHYSAYEALRGGAKAINAGIKEGVRPAENPLGLVRFAEKHIDALPDGDPYVKKLKDCLSAIRESEKAGYAKDVPYLEAPYGYSPHGAPGVGSVKNHPFSWWKGPKTGAAVPPPAPKPNPKPLDDGTVSLLDDLFANC